MRAVVVLPRRPELADPQSSELASPMPLASPQRSSLAPEAWSSNRCRESTPAESNASRCRSVV